AGMAYADWPNSGGYFLLFLPFEIWFSSWDFFIEHKHRILGTLVGCLAIMTLIANYRARADLNTLWLSGGILAAVIAQGVLGGLRVLLDARLVAMLHGCTGPLVFMLTALLWERMAWGQSGAANIANLPLAQPRSYAKLWLSAMMATLATYGQLVLGALLRHGAELNWLHPQQLRIIAVFHVLGAAVVLIATLAVAYQAILRFPRSSGLPRLGWFISGLVVLQISLGVLTWLWNYGWPWGVEALLGYFPTSWLPVTLQARDWRQVIVTTGHVAGGSLLLALSGILVAKSGRLVTRAQQSGHSALNQTAATDINHSPSADHASTHPEFSLTTGVSPTSTHTATPLLTGAA
ncbi:MAG: COX15/CtaA family protein, partial [Pirellulales bacterium]|nr:COX15/CtaA family protein [Pirellulales bacterium]